MDTQSVILAFPQKILRRVKLIVARRQTSVSNLLTQALVRIVQQKDQNTRAQRRHLQRLDRASDLGTQGTILTNREELHARR